MNDSKEYCPYCNAALQGEPIPKELQKAYGTSHFTRKIGITSVKVDSIHKWQCPDCQNKWDRVYQLK
ncbi:hypothetical protein ACN6MY_11020 [Peribacillus sp. B-H-3]|uniref:hypothetical protein n=1 Tax=Peribacillus sp. B-H-3 TaxID=3400420 RepID=UPI003B0110CA